MEVETPKIKSGSWKKGKIKPDFLFEKKFAAGFEKQRQSNTFQVHFHGRNGFWTEQNISSDRYGGQN